MKLEYCKEILKIFNSTSKNFSNFHKLIKNEIKDYTDLIIKSLETVKNFISSKFNDKENESTVLSIVYNSAISFLYLIENSKFVFILARNLLEYPVRLQNLAVLLQLMESG